jgi:hypothetical protein
MFDSTSMDFDFLGHGTTTMLTVRFGNECYHASGFYYHQYAGEPVKSEGMKVFEIKDIWLVTNRHVVLDPGINNVERVPVYLSHCQQIVRQALIVEDDERHCKKLKKEIGIRVRGVLAQERGNKNLLLLHLLFVFLCTVHRWQNKRRSRSLSCNSNLYFYFHPQHSLYLLDYNQPECLPQSQLLTQLQILQLYHFDSLPRLEYDQY